MSRKLRLVAWLVSSFVDHSYYLGPTVHERSTNGPSIQTAVDVDRKRTVGRDGASMDATAACLCAFGGFVCARRRWFLPEDARGVLFASSRLLVPIAAFSCGLPKVLESGWTTSLAILWLRFACMHRLLKGASDQNRRFATSASLCDVSQPCSVRVWAASMAKLSAWDASHPPGTPWIEHEDGGRYAGSWKQKQKHGYGVYRYPNGASYLGEWRNNQKHGRGTYQYVQGGTYEGQWKEGHKHGHGTRTYKDGRKQAGEWKQGKRIRSKTKGKGEEMNDLATRAAWEAREAAAHAQTAASRMLGEAKSSRARAKETLLDPWVVANAMATGLALTSWTLPTPYLSMANTCRDAAILVTFFAAGALCMPKDTSPTQWKLSLKAAAVSNLAPVFVATAAIVAGTLVPMSQTSVWTGLAAMASVPMPFALACAARHAESAGFYALCAVLFAWVAMLNFWVGTAIHALTPWPMAWAYTTGGWTVTGAFVAAQRFAFKKVKSREGSKRSGGGARPAVARARAGSFPQHRRSLGVRRTRVLRRSANGLSHLQMAF